MKNPLVSIIMPTYNSSKTIAQSVQSVLKQTYENWELIVVDNNSEDDTINIVKAYDDSRIFVYYNENKGIIANGRNYGIRQARGAWIAFLDSDDLWTNAKLSTCVSLSGNYDLVYHKLQKFKITSNNSLETYGATVIKNLERHPEEVLRQNGPCLTTSSVLLRREVFSSTGKFDEDPNVVGGEDYDLWLRIACKGYRFRYIQKILGGYQIDADNFSSPKKSLVIIRYLADKHFKSKVENWILATELTSYIKLRQLHNLHTRYLELLKQLKLSEFIKLNMIILKKIIRSVFGKVRRRSWLTSLCKIE